MTLVRKERIAQVTIPANKTKILIRVVVSVNVICHRMSLQL